MKSQAILHILVNNDIDAKKLSQDISSVRPILRIGEYSLVALQHRRIRYIGLRVSADAE